MQILENRCPHRIVLSRPDGVEMVVQRTHPPARIATVAGQPVDTVLGIPVHHAPGWNGIANLPPPRPGVHVVVSQIVALAVAALMPHRTDILYPGTGPGDGASRNPERGVVSISRLIRAV